MTRLVRGRRWWLFGVLDRVADGPAPGYLSRHVRAEQMASKGNGEVRAHPALLSRLDALADYLGAPIPIVSGYRDPDHNARVGGARQSQHTYGTAADIDESYGLSIELATELGFSGVGWFRAADGRRIVVHVDVRAEGTDEKGRSTNFTGAAIGAPTLWEYPA